jgi:hypothetical protein
MDAVRVKDGVQVVLKKVLPGEGPLELMIAQNFSLPELAWDYRNHCVPLLDVVELPKSHRLMVFPLLRPFHRPRFQTFGEFVAFFTQLCEVNQNPPIVCSSQGDIEQLLPRVYNLCISKT